MSRNRRRHNELPVRALSPWIIVGVMTLVAGMCWVYLQNEKHARGKEIKALENQLAELQTLNKSLAPRIADLSSRAALQKRLSAGTIKMVPITPEKLVVLNVPPRGTLSASAATDEIRAVSNRGDR